MSKLDSRYFGTAQRMDEAFLELLNEKEFEYITVKEICQKAGVNRSTFYLHYETLGDLLLETGEYIGGKYKEYFDEKEYVFPNIDSADLNDLLFINSDYLTPWLTYIKENRNLFQTIIKRSDTLKMGDSYMWLFKDVVRPILDRFNVKEENQEYFFAFYVDGIISIIKIWIKDGCKRPISDIIDIIQSCISKYDGEKTKEQTK